MSEEKPKSPYGEGGRVTETIRYNVTDSNGDRHLIIETFSIDMSGDNAGLTKTIKARLHNGEAVQDITTTNIERDGVVIDLLELAQNSPDREQKYHDRMNKTRIKALENGTSGQFDEALEKSGAYDSIAGGASINDIEIKSENTRNNEAIKDKLAKETAELERFRDTLTVGDENTLLYYPTNLASASSNGEDYIFIEQFQYSPPQPVINGNPTANPTQVITKGVPRTTNLEEKRGTCRLPIPNKLGVSNGVSWGEAKANAVELAAFGAAAGGIGNLIGGKENIGALLQKGFGGAGKVLGELRNEFQNTTGSEANAASVVSAALARSVLSTIGINVDVDQFITRQTGAAINPNLELLFSGPQLRTFSFNFNFAPESTEEAFMVRKIQRWFRQGMLPTRSASSTLNSSLFLGSPNVFRIQYRNKERRIKGLNIIKICALTSCQIDFTPDGTYQSYDDQNGVSMPVRSTMGLTFNELTPIFKDDYTTEDKYKDPSVVDLGSMVTGPDAINEHDIGF